MPYFDTFLTVLKKLGTMATLFSLDFCLPQAYQFIYNEYLLTNNVFIHLGRKFQNYHPNLDQRTINAKHLITELTFQIFSLSL